MTREEGELFYDQEIAPELLKLCRKCEWAGLSFLAMVEWEAGDNGKTMSVRAGSGIEIKLALWAMQANGNADQLIWQMQRHGKEHGHNSAALAMLDRAAVERV